jgi:hypothetical protein
MRHENYLQLIIKTQMSNNIELRLEDLNLIVQYQQLALERDAFTPEEYIKLIGPFTRVEQLMTRWRHVQLRKHYLEKDKPKPHVKQQPSTSTTSSDPQQPPPETPETNDQSTHQESSPPEPEECN